MSRHALVRHTKFLTLGLISFFVAVVVNFGDLRMIHEFSNTEFRLQGLKRVVDGKYLILLVSLHVFVAFGSIGLPDSGD